MRTDDVLAATLHRGDGYCAPESVVLGYATGARRRGATVLTGVEVVGLEPGDATTILRTTAGQVTAGAVVCAAGAWSHALGALAGVELPVTPLRRQILVTEPLPERIAAALPASMPFTIDAATTFYLHREGPGVLLGMSWAGRSPASARTATTPGCPTSRRRSGIGRLRCSTSASPPAGRGSTR